MKTKTETQIAAVPLVLEKGAAVPLYASTGAAGADLHASIAEDLVIEPGQSALVSSGVRMAIPEGYELQIRPRSGLALKHQITVLNTPGTIDSDYRGVIHVILINHSKENFTVTPGMRIAQAVLAQYVRAHFEPCTQLPETVRGSAGFGHTGTH